MNIWHMVSLYRRSLSQKSSGLSSYFCHWCRILLPVFFLIPLNSFAKKMPKTTFQAPVENYIPDIPLTSSDSSPRMIVFTIHGLGGSPSTFCDLSKVLRKDFSNLIIVEDISYSTVKNKKILSEQTSNIIEDHDLFTMEVHEQIIRAFEKYKLAPDTPIGFIAHSQGGLVGTNVSRKCFNTRPDKKACVITQSRPQPKNLKLFFTFGTPFWGSATAAGMVKSGVDFFEQINNLAYGSDIVTEIRRSMLRSYVRDANGIRQSKPFPDDMKMINIAGDISDLSFWGKFLHKNEIDSFGKVENDIVVSIPSARYDFYYNVENPFTEKTQEGFTNISSTYFPVPFPHTGLPLAERTGLACVKDNTNDHKVSKNPRAAAPKYNRMNFTSYLILLKYFDEFIGNEKSMRYFDTLKKLETMNRYVEGLRSYLSEVKVKTHPRHNVVLSVNEKNYNQYLKVVEVDPFDGSEVSESKAKIEKIISDENRILDYNGFFTSQLSNGRTILTAYHEGRFKKEYAYDPNTGKFSPAVLRYEINYPGFEPKVFYTSFVPSYSSYSEIYLKPFMPVLVNQSQCFEAQVAEIQEKGRKQIYSTALSQDGFRPQLMGTKLRVRDRYIEGEQIRGLPYHKVDRVLVQISDYYTEASAKLQSDKVALKQRLRKETETMYWMNTKDVLIFNECQKN